MISKHLPQSKIDDFSQQRNDCCVPALFTNLVYEIRSHKPFHFWRENAHCRTVGSVTHNHRRQSAVGVLFFQLERQWYHTIQPIV